jgi:hypothetical protein
MSYKISLSEDGTHILVRVLEDINGLLEKAFAQDAIVKAKQHGLTNFLVDVRGTRNTAGFIDHYQLGYHVMNEFGLDKTSKIAILADPDDQSHDFIETVFTNAGYRCRVFSDKDTALKWL